MKKILFLFVALLMSVMGAKADIAPGNYTIKAYSTGQYVVPSANWFADGKVTGANKATYSSTATKDNGGFWTIANATSGGGYTITPTDASFVYSNGDHGYLNPWDAEATMTSGPVGCWKTTDGDDRWGFTPVEGHENVYTIKALNKTFADVYLYCNASETLLYFNAPGTPAESNWFYVEEVVETTPEVPETPAIVSYKTFTTSPAPVNGEFVNGTKFYTIQCKGSNNNEDYYLSTSYTNTNGLALSNSSNPNSDAGKWAAVQTANGIQFYNKAEGTAKVLTFTASANNAYANMGTNLTSALSYFVCETSRNERFSTGYECFKLNDENGIYWNRKNNTLSTWNSEQALWGWGYSATNPSTGDAGSSFKFTMVEEIGNVSFDITYNYSIDGKVFASETISCINGQDFPEPTKSFTGYTLSAKPAGTVAGEGTYTITLGAFDGPFVPTTIANGEFAEGTKWYYVQNGNNNGNGYVVYLNDADKKSVVTTTAGATDLYKWTFVRKEGTPYFYLYNKAAGTVAMHEQLSTNTIYAPYHNQGYVVAKETAEEMPLQLYNNKNGFSLKLANAEGTCLLGKHVGTNLSIWGNGADINNDGSRFTFTEAPAENPSVAYTVKVLGADLKVTVKGTEYTNGATTDPLKDLTETDVTPATSDDYVGTVAFDGTNIVVTYHHKGAAIDFAGKNVTVGEMATTIVPDTKWYVLTQLRGGETPTWVNTENKVMRAGEAAANLFPGKAEELASYLVRFVSTNVEGVYEIQHGNGMYWNTPGAQNTKLTASANVADSKFYFLYKATQTSGNVDGWAMNYTTDFATKANIVDNDGKGSTVGYWGTGNVTSGSNNVWFIYETTIEVPTEPVVPEFDAAKKYTIDNVADKRGKLAYNPAGDNFVGLADVTLATNYASKHASSSNPEVGIEWQLTQVGADKVTLKNLKNDKYAVIQNNGKCVWGDEPYEYVFTKYEGYYTLQGNGTPSSNLLTAACGWDANQGPVYLEGTTVKNEHKFVITEVEEPVAPSYTEEEIAALQNKIDGLIETVGTVGYPSDESEEAQVLMNNYNLNFSDGVTAANYEAAQAALTAYYNCTDVVLPETGKYYEIKAVYHDGKSQYLGYDGTKLSVTDAKPATGTATFKAESVAGNNVVLTIGGKYVHWTSGDDTKKTADTDGLNEELDANLNTLVFTKATAEGGATPITLTNATPEKLFGLFQIQGKSSGSQHNGPLFYFTTRSNGIFIAGDSGNKFFDTNWNSDGTNRTSYFTIAEVEAPVENALATEEAIQNAQELLWAADHLGYPKGDDDVVTALAALLEQDNVTKEDLDAAVLAYKNCTNVVLPEKNQFYILTGTATNGVLAGANSGAAPMIAASEVGETDPFNVNLSLLYYYSPEGYLINYNGGRALKGNQLVTSAGNPDVFTFCHETLTELGTLTIKNAAGQYLLDQNHNLSTTATAVGAATNWGVEPYGYMPINVGSTGYATVYLPYSVAAAPEYNIKGVYVVKNDGDALTTSKVTEIGCIPAHTAVIVEAEPNTNCTGKGMGGEDAWEPSEEVAAKIEGNVLQGTIIAMNKPDNALVFNVKNDVPGFYNFTGTVLAGFKAYYPYTGDAASNGIALRFDDVLTAIESAIETSKGHVIFDLQGRRVSAAQKGIFIQNGKKVIK